ncbi:MAG: hypothetical protein HFJ32_00625 [Clostridia bacterium]|nr:hypothetical protein [Clostridia bacterium]
MQSLNDTFINTNIEVGKNPNKIGDGIENIQQEILKIVQYYDTNKFDLETFNILFNDLELKWEDFRKTYCQYANKYDNTPVPEQIRKELGKKLQAVKDKNQEIILRVRKEY